MCVFLKLNNESCIFPCLIRVQQVLSLCVFQILVSFIHFTPVLINSVHLQHHMRGCFVGVCFSNESHLFPCWIQIQQALALCGLCSTFSGDDYTHLQNGMRTMLDMSAASVSSVCLCSTFSSGDCTCRKACGSSGSGKRSWRHCGSWWQASWSWAMSSSPPAPTPTTLMAATLPTLQVAAVYSHQSVRLNQLDNARYLTTHYIPMVAAMFTMV